MINYNQLIIIMINYFKPNFWNLIWSKCWYTICVISFYLVTCSYRGPRPTYINFVCIFPEKCWNISYVGIYHEVFRSDLTIYVYFLYGAHH